MLSLPKTVKLEKEYENEILDYLNQRGDCLAFKVNTMGVFDITTGRHRSKSKYDLNGQADITAAFKGGIVIFFEVKKPGGRQSPAQKAFEDRLKKLGNRYFVVVTVDDVRKAINESL